RERQAMLDGQRDLVSELKNARDRSAELELDLSARREAELGLRGRLEAFEADLTQRVQEHEALLRRYSELARERDGLREELLALDDREKSLRAEEQRLAARARAAESERDAARARLAEAEALKQEAARLRSEVTRGEQALEAAREELERRMRAVAD